MKTRVCEKCNQEYQSKFIHNGKTKYLGNKRRFCLECSPYGSGNRYNLRCNDMENKRCPICKNRKSRKEFTFSGNYCRSCNSTSRKQHRKIVKKFLVDLKGGKCSVCSYDKCIDALVFHHINPEEKDFEIGRANSSRFTIEQMTKEVEKCQLLCFNCHAELHANIRNNYSHG